MTDYLAPISFALFIWWFSTGAILYMDGLPRRTFLWSMLGATLVLAIGLSGLALTRNDLSILGAYSAFTSAVMVWAWQEVGFLLGYITGPRRVPLPLDCKGNSRFVYALQTILYHEFALILLALAAYSMTADGTNKVGLWTFAVLWTMRQSAKLNLFLGVRNLGENFLPEQLRYLASYFTRKPMNPLFPVSVITSLLFAAYFWREAYFASSGSFEATGNTLVATLLSLAILEHLFMILPLPTDKLWGWGLRSHKSLVRRDAQDAGMEMTSWSAPLSEPCDPQGLHRLLEAGAQGAFGEVDRINGVARADTGWICFEMVSGHSRISSIEPGERMEPRVTATGRWMDRVRLQAAFDACALPV